MRDLRASILWWALKRRITKDKPKIIAITGTVAKTSTKEAIGCVLKAVFKDQVRISFGNLNSFLGIPLGAFGFKLDFYKKKITWQWVGILLHVIWQGLFAKLPRILVLEFAVDQPKDMEMLTEQIKPDIGIITIVGEAHLESFESHEQYAREKSKLALSVKEDGLLILNKRDPFLHFHTRAPRAKIEYIDCPNSEIAFTLAKKIGQVFNIVPNEIEKALEDCQLPEGRLNKFSLKSWVVLDDSYNANPLSMKTALDILTKMPNRKVAILGEMKELGDTGEALHEEIGQYARKKADLIIGIGEMAKLFKADYWFEDVERAGSQVLAYLKEGDSILVKGSHSVHMEKVVEALRK